MRLFRTGLKQAPEPPQLRFGSYFKATALPAAPPTFGHYSLVTSSWGMLANDQLSDCTIAGAMHCIMLWNATASKKSTFTALDAQDDYADACGYVPGHPDTDNGGDMVSVAQYWKNVGMRDCTGARHKIAAYLQIDATNLVHLDAAAYLFDAVGLGVSLPDSAETQFTNGQPWSLIPGDTAVEYHYVPYVGKDANRKVVTWGALQDIEEPWLQANLKEAVAMISVENMVNQKNPEGFSYDQLSADLVAL
jgi:hypothetical protein